MLRTLMNASPRNSTVGGGHRWTSASTATPARARRGGGHDETAIVYILGRLNGYRSLVRLVRLAFARGRGRATRAFSPASVVLSRISAVASRTSFIARRTAQVFSSRHSSHFR